MGILKVDRLLTVNLRRDLELEFLYIQDHLVDFHVRGEDFEHD